MTHPERKAVSDEREKCPLCYKTDGPCNSTTCEFPQKDSDHLVIARLEIHLKECRYDLRQTALKLADMLRADAEKDETIENLKALNVEFNNLSHTFQDRCIALEKQLAEKDETIDRLSRNVLDVVPKLAEKDETIRRLRGALELFRKAKAWVAADSYDGIDERGRNLLEEADIAASLAATASPAPDTKDGGEK